jgi:FKBP-type peptidyl-prolyl cis-trans isomerase
MSDVRNYPSFAKVSVASVPVLRAERHRGRPGVTAGLAAAGILALALAGCGGNGDAASAPAAPLADDGAKASYSLGYRFADNVNRQFDDEIDNDAFVRGVRDNLAGDEPLVDDAEAERVLTVMMEARQAAVAGEALRTLEQGLSFLEQNAQREEVVALESGLQYEVMVAGEGPNPGAEDIVTTHYEGRLIDGTVFDSSYERGEPATFPLNQVIPGWTEGLQLMAPGAKHRLFVPSHLAYGDRAAGSIPPNSTLIFDVELLSIEAAGGAAP